MILFPYVKLSEKMCFQNIKKKCIFRVKCPADWFNTNHVLVVKYKLQVRVCWLALTSAVGAHSPILGGAAWPSVWHHHCPPISCGDVQRAPRRLGSTPWEEGGAGTAWRRKWHFLFDLFLTCLLSKICSQLDKIIINYIKYSYGHTHTHTSLCSAPWSEAPGLDFPWTPSVGWTGSSRAFWGRPGPRILPSDWLSGRGWWRGWSCADAACGASLETPDHLQGDEQHHLDVIVDWTILLSLKV